MEERILCVKTDFRHKKGNNIFWSIIFLFVKTEILFLKIRTRGVIHYFEGENKYCPNET